MNFDRVMLVVLLVVSIVVGMYCLNQGDSCRPCDECEECPQDCGDCPGGICPLGAPLPKAEPHEITFHFGSITGKVVHHTSLGDGLHGDRYWGTGVCGVCQQAHSFKDAHHGALYCCNSCFHKMSTSERRAFVAGLISHWESQGKLVGPDTRRLLDEYYGQTAYGRRGNWECQRCKKTMVGDQVHTVWIGSTEEGIASEPLTYLCEKCWAQTTDHEREQFCGAWLTRMGVAPERKEKLMAQYRAARLQETR